MRVFVLGHRGMLGHVAARYLAEQGCEVVTSRARYTALPGDPLVEEVRTSGCEWVVNAIGRIKQKTQAADELYAANSLFPHHLKAMLGEGQRLIHASTDCVFSGERGGYAVDELRDACDVYGLSKILGETVAGDRCTVLRVSIIGPELGNGHGLMGWFLRQRGSVNGFRNHLWNGITTLEWSKVCLRLMREGAPAPLVQAGAEAPVTKYELLRLISDCWAHDVDVRPVDAPEAVDRTLVPTWVCASVRVQLEELRAWYPSAPATGPIASDEPRANNRG